MTLKEYLTRTGRKQVDLASTAGVSQAHISQICKFGRRPSPDVAARISRATNGEVAVLDLLYPDGVFENQPESVAA